MDDSGQWKQFCAEQRAVNAAEQAHAMSHPEVVKACEQIARGDFEPVDIDDDKPDEGGVQHVSDAAWAVLCREYPESTSAEGRDEWGSEYVDQGLVLRTVAEWQHMEAAARDYWTIRGEADMLRSQLAANAAEVARLRRDVRIREASLKDMVERLREGREDERTESAAVRVSDDAANRDLRDSAAANLLSGGMLSLDPRLGVQQPAGEPGTVTEYWRRSGV